VVLTNFTVSPSVGGTASSTGTNYTTSTSTTAQLTVNANYRIAATQYVTDALVEIKLTNLDEVGQDGQRYFDRAPWNGNHAYFTTADDDILILWPKGSGNHDVNVDPTDNSVTVSFTVSGHQSDIGNIVISYNFNAATFGGWLPNGTPIATITAGGDATAPNPLSVTSMGTGSAFGFAVPNSNTARLGTRVYISSFYVNQSASWRLEPNSAVTMTLEYPENAALSIPTGYGPMTNTTAPSENPGYKKTTWVLGPGGQADANGQIGANETRSYTGYGYSTAYQLGLTFTDEFFNPGDVANLTATATFQRLGESGPTTYTQYGTFNILEALVTVTPNVHMSANTLSLDANNTRGLRLEDEAGESYAYQYLNYNVINAGLQPIPNTRLTWRNGATDKKLNLTSVRIYNSVNRFKSKLVYYIKDAAGEASAERQAVYYANAAASVTGTNYVSVNTSVALGTENALQPGEYIDRVEVYPLNNPITDTITSANEDLALPAASTSMQCYFFYGNWPGNTYPDGTQVQHKDYVSATVNLHWEGEEQPPTPGGNVTMVEEEEPEDPEDLEDPDYIPTYTVERTSSTGTADTASDRIWFIQDGAAPTVRWVYGPDEPTSSNKRPGALLDMRLQFYNSSVGLAGGLGSTWHNPVIYWIPPDGLEIEGVGEGDSRQVNVYNANNTSLTTPVATATITRTTRTYNGVQKLAFKIAVNEEMSLTSGSYTNAAGKLIPVKVKIREDAVARSSVALSRTNPIYNSPSGVPLFSATGVSACGILFGASGGPILHTFPPYISYTSNNAYLDTYNLDENPNTAYFLSTDSPMFTIPQMDGVSVSAEMYNNRLAEPDWQHVNTQNAEATVNVEDGEGQFRLVIKNTGNSYLGNIVLLDILPSLGDKMVLDPSLGKGSEWQAVLKEPLDVKVEDAEEQDVTSQFSSYYTVLYSTQGDPSYTGGTDGINRQGSDPTFSGTEIFNASANYKSFHFQWVNTVNRRLPPGHTLTITGTIKALDNTNFSDEGKAAYNSFAVQAASYTTNAVSTTSGKSAILFEPTKQTFVLADLGTSTIEGRVFKDYNGDDVYDAGDDAGYEGITVKRYRVDEDGNPTGSPTRTTTGEDGEYAFLLVAARDYLIEVEKPDGSAYQFAAKGADGDTNASHVGADGQSESFTLAEGETKANLNAGIRANGLATVQFREGSAAGTQVGSDSIAKSAVLGAAGILGNIVAGVDVTLPQDYHLAETETAAKSYTLTWDAPTQTIIYVVDPNAVTVTAPPFDTVIVGYDRPAAKPITIANGGNSAATINSVTSSDPDMFEIGGSGGSVGANSSIDTWTVQPAAELGIGPYTATITVTYSGGVTAIAKVSITVAEQMYELQVVNGTGSGNYAAGVGVSISANGAPGGAEFYQWTSSVGGSFLSQGSAYTTFTMPPNAVTVTAGYRWQMPDATINFAEEWLEDLTDGGIYTFNGTQATYSATAYYDISGIISASSQVFPIIRIANGSSITTDSVAQNLPIPARPGIPNVEKMDETVDGREDGTITGVSSFMEWRTGTSGDWTDVATSNHFDGGALTNLAQGAYQVRWKATELAFAGTPQDVTIGQGEPQSRNLIINGGNAITIGGQPEGYAGQPSYSISIYNDGNSTANITNIEVSNENFEIIPVGTIIGNIDAGATDNVTWSVRAKNGLSVTSGQSSQTYSAVITVTYNGTTATQTVNFTVTAVPHTLTIMGGGSGATAGGSYVKGTPVGIDAGTKSGQTFNGWTVAPVGSGTFTDAGSPQTTFTMPNTDVTITATWRWNMPEAGIDYVNEKLTGLIAGVQYTFSGGFGTATGAADTEGYYIIPETWMTGNSVSLTRNQDGDVAASSAQGLVIKARPVIADGAVTKTDETIAGLADGTITGVTALMEWRPGDSGNWTDGTGATLTGRAAGNYQVRIKQAGNNFSGAIRTVTINQGAAQTRTPQITNSDPITFASTTVDYSESQWPAAQTIYLENSGNSLVTIKSVAVSDVTKFALTGADFTVGPKTGNVNGTNNSWSVRPAIGLSAGTHTGSITITYYTTAATGDGANTATISVGVSFTVIQTYMLTVIGGTDLTNQGPYVAGAQVSISAAPPSDGKIFRNWTSGDGVSFTGGTSAVNEQATFTMPENDVTITANYDDEINVSVPIKLLFAAFESGEGTVTSPNYQIINNGNSAIKVSVTGISIDPGNGAGLNLVDTEGAMGDGDIRLKLQGTQLFSTTGYLTTDSAAYSFGTLGAKNTPAATGKFNVTGDYNGDFNTNREPYYTVNFSFALNS
jgi:hypothetical protein